MFSPVLFTCTSLYGDSRPQGKYVKTCSLPYSSYVYLYLLFRLFLLDRLFVSGAFPPPILYLCFLLLHHCYTHRFRVLHRLLPERVKTGE